MDFKNIHANPDYAIMNEVLPLSVHMKLKLSSFVQMWCISCGGRMQIDF